MSIIGSLIGAAGTIGAGLIGANSAKDTNSQMLAYSREAAQNKYQWSVADMEKAGLNPKLAGTQAASVSGAQVPNLKNPGDSIVSGVQAAADILSKLSLTYSSAKKNMADAKAAEETAKTTGSLRSFEIGLKERQGKLLEVQALLAGANETKSYEEAQYMRALAFSILEDAYSKRRANDIADAEAEGLKAQAYHRGKFRTDYGSFLGPMEVIGSSARDMSTVFDKTFGKVMMRLIPNFSGILEGFLNAGKKGGNRRVPRIRTKPRR